MKDISIRSPVAEAVDSLSKAIEAKPERARRNYPPATATLVNGLKCRVTGPSGEQIETDMPASVGGGNSMPSPGWFFRASYASCCLTVIALQAARLGIELSDIAVTVDGDGDYRGMLGLDDKISAGHLTLRTNVRIGAKNASPEQLRALVRWAVDHAPVGCTVRDAPTNTVDIDVV